MPSLKLEFYWKHSKTLCLVMDAQADYTLKLSWAISKLVQRKWKEKSKFTHWRWFRAFAFIHAAATICKSVGWRGACLKVVKGDTVHLTITEEWIDMHALDFNASNMTNFKKKQFPSETHTAPLHFEVHCTGGRCDGGGSGWQKDLGVVLAIGCPA